MLVLISLSEISFKEFSSIVFLSIFQISTGFSSALLFIKNEKNIIVKNNFYLTILKFSLGIIFSISFLVQENLFYLIEKQFQELQY